MFFAYALQVGLVAVATTLLWVFKGGAVGIPALWGSMVALVNIGLLVWRWRQGRYDYHCDGPRHLKQFHRSALERFFVVAMLLAIGMILLKLSPLPVLLGFIVGQVAWLIAAATLKTD